MQMFVYSELLTQTYGKYFTPYIVAVSKQEQVDKELIRIDELTLVIGQEVFEKYVHRLKQVISGKVAPAIVVNVTIAELTINWLVL